MNNPSNWFEVTTYRHDPTRIEMRRLSPDEAETAAREAIEAQAQEIAKLFQVKPLSDYFTDIANVLVEFAETLDDPKQKDRERSFQDLRQKRAWLKKNRKNY